jgi:hypothetical protein
LVSACQTFAAFPNTIDVTSIHFSEQEIGQLQELAGTARCFIRFDATPKKEMPELVSDPDQKDKEKE